MQYLQVGEQVLFKRTLDRPLEPAWVGNVEDEHTLNIYTLKGPLFGVTYGGAVGQWRHIPSREHWVPESDDVATYRTRYREDDETPEAESIDYATVDEVDELRGTIRELQDTISALKFREPVSDSSTAASETSSPTTAPVTPPVSQSGLE